MRGPPSVDQVLVPGLPWINSIRGVVVEKATRNLRSTIRPLLWRGPLQAEKLRHLGHRGLEVGNDDADVMQLSRFRHGVFPYSALTPNGFLRGSSATLLVECRKVASMVIGTSMT